jgi:hypothetical protein
VISGILIVAAIAVITAFFVALTITSVVVSRIVRERRKYLLVSFGCFSHYLSSAS